jgi:hypothetical protein
VEQPDLVPAAAVIGPVVEIVLVKVGVFAYHDASDALFGVGLWLPALYFAFGLMVALLGESVAKARQSAHATV